MVFMLFREPSFICKVRMYIPDFSPPKNTVEEGFSMVFTTTPERSVITAFLTFSAFSRYKVSTNGLGCAILSFSFTVTSFVAKAKGSRVTVTVNVLLSTLLYSAVQSDPPYVLHALSSKFTVPVRSLASVSPVLL